MDTSTGRRPRVLAGLLAALAFGACSDLTSGGGGPAVIDVTSEVTTVAAGTPLAFRYEATGTYITYVVVAYGDGMADSVLANGAQSASGHLSHSWETAGEYAVVATLFDASQGDATDQVTIQVTAPGGP